MKNKNLVYIILGLVGVVIIATVLIINRDRPPVENVDNIIKQQEIDQRIIKIPIKDVSPIITTNVILKTNRGDIKIGLFNEHRPITTGNFVSLIEKNFYDGLIFHRVIDGFMIQGGCPYGTGFGGPGHTIKCELEGNNRNVRGTISMANAGPNTGGSQFFINLVDNNFLDNRHSVFGRVIKGMDVVNAIGKVETTFPGDRPIQDVVIKNIEIVEK
jgi:peptidylprolyl isomerase